MLDERDSAAWADIERRLCDEGGSRDVVLRLFPPGRITCPAWLPYVAAVVAPLLLPVLVLVEMRPISACVGGLVAISAAFTRWIQRTEPHV
jgi:hypothetical protein